TGDATRLAKGMLYAQRLQFDGATPPTIAGDNCFSLCWTPGVRFICVQGSDVTENLIDHSPGSFDAVLTRKESSVATESIAEQPFLRRHFVARLMARDQLHLFADHRLAWDLGPGVEGDEDIGAQTEADEIRLFGAGIKDGLRRRFEFDHHLGRRDGHPFAHANIERNSSPTPGVDMQLDCCKSLDLRIARHALLIAIPAKLAAHDV